MRILNANLTPYCLPLKHPWVSRRGRFTARVGFLVKLEGDGGVIGVGECAPLTDAGTESFPVSESWLRRELPARLDQEVEEALNGLPSPGNAPAARCGLETALFDLLAKAKGTSIAALLSPSPAETVSVSGHGGALDEEVENRLPDGFSVVKVKVGLAPVEEELGRLQQLKHLDLTWRLDANQAWDEAEAARFIEGLEGLAVDSLEEPLRSPDPEAWRRLQERTPIPLARDESLADLALQEISARRIMLKPMVLGGLRPALSLARSSGAEAVVTTTIDAAVGTWAAVHLAAALPGPKLAHGLATSDWLMEDVGTPPPIDNGVIRL